MTQIGPLDCPACGLKSAFEEPESWEICNRCGWEDDPLQREQPDFSGGANEESLEQARTLWKEDPEGVQKAQALKLREVQKIVDELRRSTENND